MKPRKLYLLDGEIIPPKGSKLRAVSVYARMQAYSPRQAVFLLMRLHKSPEGSVYRGAVDFKAMIPGECRPVKKVRHKPNMTEGQLTMF